MRSAVQGVSEHRRVGHAPLFEARPVSVGWRKRDWRFGWQGSWDQSPFVLLLVVEFVDEVAAGHSQADVKILAIGIAPVNGVGEQIDEDFLSASGAVGVYGLLEALGATCVVHRGLLFV